MWHVTLLTSSVYFFFESLMEASVYTAMYDLVVEYDAEERGEKDLLL